MPYIKQERRDAIWGESLNDYDSSLKNAGELNYFVTYLCDEYLRNHGTSYQSFNDIIGALEGCKLELYRRLVSPYEDKKIKENGDVFPSKKA